MIDKMLIRGAKVHNLKNIDLALPRDKLIVMTGLSGSGKSSLAFDTVYAEGQRRYVESLSSYARQFLELMKKPDVDSIEGLSPAISIEQKTTSHNPRSTVGTVTEIYDYMRLLWARAGTPYSPATGLPIESQTVSQMVDRIAALPEGSRILLLAPIVTALVALTGSWRLLLPIYAGLTVLGGIWLQATSVAEPPRGDRAAGMADCFRLLGNPTVLLCTLGVACFIAGDVGIGFLSVRLIDNPDSILTTTGFYACRIVGTLVGAWVLVRVSDVKYLRWNMAGALALCAVLLLVRGETAVYAAVGLTGFAMACVFATFYAVATKAVPEKANEVAGLMILAISAGAVSGPVCGAIVRWSGDAHRGMLFVALCVGYMLWASFKLKIKQ